MNLHRPLRAILKVAVVMGVAVACGGALGPDEEGAWTRLLADRAVDGVTVTLHAAETTVSPGDTLHFTAIAFNATDHRIQLGEQCGPTMDVLITTPADTVRSLLADLLGGHGAFTCELRADHFVEPQGERTLDLWWVAPAGSGEYTARAGLRRSDGLSNPSSPVSFEVR